MQQSQKAVIVNSSYMDGNALLLREARVEFPADSKATFTQIITLYRGEQKIISESTA